MGKVKIGEPKLKTSPEVLRQIVEQTMGPDVFLYDWPEYYRDKGEFHGPLRIEAALTEQEKNDELTRLAGNFILAAHSATEDDLASALHVWSETQASIRFLRQNDPLMHERVKNLTSWAETLGAISRLHDKGRRGFIKIKGHPSSFGDRYVKLIS